MLWCAWAVVAHHADMRFHTTHSNEALRERVEASLLEVLPFEAVHIGVAVKAGAVCLTGRVLHREARHVATKAAIAAGAKAVADDIVVVGSDLHPNDVDVAAAVHHALAHAPQLAHGRIVPVVREGYVTLTGEVSTEDERVAADRVAHHIHGVTGVDNRLRVDEPIH